MNLLTDLDFVGPILFPDRNQTELEILCFKGEAELDSSLIYDYITLAELKPDAASLHRMLTAFLPRLKPGGAIAAGVYGVCGYAGLMMLRTIIKNFSPDIEPTDRSTIEKVIRSVIARLPNNHPAWSRKDWIENLQKGDKETIREFLDLTEEKIFSVSQVLAVIEAGGGRLLRWVFPELYDPAKHIKDRAIADRLSALPEPGRSKVAELVNAQPMEHYFFVKKPI
ncbi:MAG: hypothetical protein ACM3SY_21425 [Candidatus Omnitrophota bacterium]